MIYLVWSFGAIATGVFVGLHILLPGLMVLVSAICAILLARVHRYSLLVRNATLLWFGLIAAALITLGVANLRDAADYGGAVFAFGALLLVLPVPLVAYRKPK